MSFIIAAAFSWSPNGFDIEEVEAGEHEELPERAIEIAESLGVLNEVDDKAQAEKKAREEAEAKAKAEADLKARAEAEKKVKTATAKKN